MNAVSAWAAGLCVAAIACTAMQMLAPKNGLGRIFKLIIAAFFLICMITPLAGLPSLLAEQLPSAGRTAVEAEDLEDTALEQMEAQINARLLTIVREALAGDLAGGELFVQKVAVTMDTDENGGIYINGVTVWLDGHDGSAPTEAAVRQKLEEALGVDVNVR